MDTFLSPDSPNSDSNPSFHWWRSSQEFINEAHLKFDFSNLSKLSPTLKVLREMERLAMVAPDSLDDLRQKLLSYRSGDFWLPTGGIKKEEMEIPPVITILLVGFAGSGKSSVINLMYSVLGRAGLIPFAQTGGKMGKCQTMFMEEHNVVRSVRNGFCVYDTRGFDYENVREGLEGMEGWMTDGVHHHQMCWRESDEVLERPQLMVLPSAEMPSKFARRRVNCTVLVVDMAEIYRALMGGDSRPLEATKELFSSPAIRKCNENPIMILTHGDLLSTEERLQARVKICEFMGTSETTGAYDIACLTEHGFIADDADPVTAYTLTEAVYRALLFSDRSHPPRRNWKDIILNWLDYFVYFLSAFFGHIAYWLSKFGHKKLKRLTH